MDYVTFTIIVDDIVYPDGHTAMTCLGGGGAQTAFGMKLWSSEQERLGKTFILTGRDNSLLDYSVVTFNPALSATLLEDDGRRGQVWRMELGEDVWPLLRPSIKELPVDYRSARAYHACVHPSGLDVGFIQDLRSSGAKVVSIEPYTQAEAIVTLTELRGLVSGGHIFSPNENEAISLVGPGPPLDLISRLVELGAEVALSTGNVTGYGKILVVTEMGSLHLRADTGETWEVPAFHSVLKLVKRQTELSQVDASGLIGVIDPTGCGNTFCGGFLAGWVKKSDLLTAALWGSIAASFMAEHEGVPSPPLSLLKQQATARLDLLRTYATQLK